MDGWKERVRFKIGEENWPGEKPEERVVKNLGREINVAARSNPDAVGAEDRQSLVTGFGRL